MVRNKRQTTTSRQDNASPQRPLRAFPLPPSAFRLPPSTFPLPPSALRPAFTLVELLVAIAILAILAGLTMVGVGAANETAKKRKTETMVATLHSMLMERYDSYQTRRVPISSSGLTPQEAAAKRLEGIRLLMAIEMPDRWDEVGMSDAEITNRLQYGLISPAEFNGFRTSLYNAYARQKTAAVTNANQGAECLYMIITMGTGEGEALSFFRDRDIGDVDGDGAKEFLDAWGNPIFFLRWPAGFASEMQTGDPVEDHDPFDPLRLDMPAAAGDPPRGYRLVPLVYSRGPDGDADIVSIGNGWNPTFDPYEPVMHDGADVGPRGTPRDDEGDEENWHDNIHNHLLQRR